MNYLKQHKFTAVVIFAFIIVFIMLFFAWRTFFSNSGNPEYGNRLDGIEEAEITTANTKKIEDKLKENKNVKSVNINISGRTLDIVICVDDEVSISDAKKIGANSYSSLDEKQIDYYSIQVFVKKEDEEKNNFPIIGYKQKGKKDIVWTKDRKVTTNEK